MKKNIIHKLKNSPLIKIFSYLIINLGLTTKIFALEDPGVSENSGCPANQICNPLKAKTLIALIKDVVDIIMQIGLVVAVVAIIWAGFLYVTAQGSEEKVKKAHSIFLWTIVGVAIILGAKVIVEVVENFFLNV